MTDRLQNKVAIVFGAGSIGPPWGNGEATAALFATNGANVICVDINWAAAEETTDIITCEGGRASAYACDVTDSAAVSDLVASVVREHGRRIDVLHNNVGYATMGGPIKLDEAAWQRTFDLNVKSCFITCKQVLPHMLERKSGAIVNVSSIAAIRYTGYPYAAYYPAKAAVNNFTMGLALQYARDGIRVNAIMPGLMNTPLISQQISGQYADADAMVAARDAACPTGKMGTAWDIASRPLPCLGRCRLHHGRQPARRWRAQLPRGLKLDPCPAPQPFFTRNDHADRPFRSRLPPRDPDRPRTRGRDHRRRAVERHLCCGSGRDARTQGTVGRPRDPARRP
jgi:NAD(P)-dependent dehydrogenase (short-subunit alcohol dehydrogenase family)